MTAILLWMARLDPFDADAQPEPSDGELAQVEERVRRSERNTVVAADADGRPRSLKSLSNTVKA